MNLRIHCFQHVAFEGLASIGDWARRAGHDVTSTHWYRGDTPPPLESIDWLVVMGGPMNVYEEDRYGWLAEEKRCIEQAIGAGKTLLGVCLGAQLIADVLGGKVLRNRYKEIGWFPIKSVAGAETTPLSAVPSGTPVFHWHGDTFEIPPGAVHAARSAACENQAFVYEGRVVGLQFHLETTPESARALIANCGKELVEAPFIQSAEAMLAEPARFDRVNRVMDDLLDALKCLGS